MDVGPYQLIKKLADGVVGPLLLCEERQGKRRVLVWELPRVADGRVLQRLAALSRRVADSAQANSPGGEPLVKLPDGRCLWVRPVPTGQSLADVLEACVGNRCGDGLPILATVCEQLKRLHSQGLWHLALHPALIFVDWNTANHLVPEVRLQGTGLAAVLHIVKPTVPGPASFYLAPEQQSDATEQPIDGAVDIYALGMILIQVLLGIPADGKHGSHRIGEYLSRLADQNTSGDLLRLLRKMLSLRPSERPKIQEVAQTLRTIAEQEDDDETMLQSRMRPNTVPRLEAVRQPEQAPKVVNAATQQISAADTKVGSFCGNFRILRKLGEGGMGVVYEAEHKQIGKRASVKLMHTEFAQNAEFAARFLNEARAVNIIRHPSLVEIFEYGQLPDGTLFIVMEFLEGQTLFERFVKCAQPGPLLPCLHIAHQVAQALSAAHEKNLVHRDLKPENIMLVADPLHPGELRVKVLDFGIAKLARRSAPSAEDRTRVGAFMGTPLYMAPEQHGRAEEVDGRADVFAFGVVLHELLAGKPPFQGSAISLLGKSAPLLSSIRSDLPAGLSEMVQRMMSLESTQRPSMPEVEQTLAGYLRKSSSRIELALPKLALIGSAAALLLLLVVLLGIRMLRPPTLAEARSKALEVVTAALQAPDSAQRVSAIGAVAESKDSSLRGQILPFLSSDNPTVKEAAARALGDIGALDATRELLPLLESQNETVRLSAARALARLSNPSGPKTLKELLDQGSDAAKLEAAVSLLEFGDLSGSPLLHRIVARASGSDARVLAILSALAKAGDVEARQKLTEQRVALAGSPQGPKLSFSLARIGERDARIQLEELAQKAGPSQLLAARLLAGLGDSRGYALLLDTARSGQKTEAERSIAVDGLADLSQMDAVAPLTKMLGERGISAPLRLLVAGAILELAAGEKGQLAEQSLSWARSALGSDSVATRELATTLLGELDSQGTIAPLAQSLKDQEREVRRSAARSLGKKRAREALEALTSVLEDSDDELRAISMRSIGSISTALRKNGAKTVQDADRQVVSRLQKLVQSRSEQDRVVAAGTLLQMGDKSQRSVIEVSLLSSNPLVRRLAVEMIDADSRELVKALADSDRLVRFAAARRLAATGSKEAIPVLHEIVGAGDIEGLTAYGILKRMGESIEQPPGLQSLLTSGALSERFAVMDVVGELPPSLAQQLLLVASNDPASVIRRRAADIASRLFHQTKQVAFLRTLRALTNDPEAAVRSRARELQSAIPKEQESTATDSIETEEVKSSRPSSTTTTTEQGQLLLVGEDGVRVQIDKTVAQAISTKPIVLSVGKHRISYLGGQQEVTIASGGSISVKIPTTLAEQLVQDAIDAFKSRELVRAQGYLDRSRRLMLRVGTKPIVKADHTYVQGKVNEAKNLLQQAMAEYTTYQKLPSAQQRPEYLADVRSAMARLAPRMGRIQVFTMRDGRCQMEEIYLPPGDQTVSLGPGQTKVVSVYAGVTTPVRSCQ
jgi:serine/threonine protein kinase/HEAT repeat protein